ncbi:MAG: phytanoyl-CoA dioxygenase family protein [Candidatus Latescibacteria bacterium]|nr:phytanoyl-CoA dioxygenase family protein [Candidatus Latescibacterota bacterium]
MLSQDQVYFYQQQGYLVVEDVLSSAEVGRAQGIVDDFVEQSRRVTQQGGHFDLEPGHSAAEPKVRRMINPVDYHPFFDQIMRDSRILDCLESLIGPAIRAQGNKLNMKPGTGGSAVEWHQDFAHYPHTNDDLCAVGLALDTATMDNGCMLVVPGSHRGPILDHHQDGYFIGAISPERDGIDLVKAVPLAMPAGAISIHHTSTLHGSAANVSGQSRRLLLYQYAAVDAWPLGGVGDWDTFNGQILRGDITYEFRHCALVTRTRMPAGDRGGSGIYELQKPLIEKTFAAPA